MLFLLANFKHHCTTDNQTKESTSKSLQIQVKSKNTHVSHRIVLRWCQEKCFGAPTAPSGLALKLMVVYTVVLYDDLDLQIENKQFQKWQIIIQSMMCAGWMDGLRRMPASCFLCVSFEANKCIL